METPDFDQKGEGRGLGRVPAPKFPAPSLPSPSGEALEGLPAPGSAGRDGLELPVPGSVQGDDHLLLDGNSLNAIQYFFHRKNKKEDRIKNSRSLRDKILEISSPEAKQVALEPRMPVDPATMVSTLDYLHSHEQAPELERLLSSFPVFGGNQDRIVREEELDGLIPEHFGLENAVMTLRSMDLVEPLEVLGEWQLTSIGEAVVRRLMLDDDLETSANVLDAQTAFLTSRLVNDGRAVGAFLESTVYLLAHGLLESELGHPTRWGTAMRAVRNAVMVDLERPGSLLSDSGGLCARDIATLGAMAQVSPLAGGAFPPELRTLAVVLATRERIQQQAGRDPEQLRGILLSPEVYQDLDRQMMGLRAMAHVAWVSLAREASPRAVQATAEALAHAVTGVRVGGVFHASDLALLTPDHREHLLLVIAARENRGFQIAGTMDEARRRLAMVYPQLEEEYPRVGERSRAAARILAAHTECEAFSEEQLQAESMKVMDHVNESKSFTNELTALALRLQPGQFGKSNSGNALHTLVRRYCDAEDPDRTIDYTDTMVAAAEWVSVAERLSSFHSMQEAQVYRYALLEAMGRPGFKKPQRDAMGRMFEHATSLMTVLAQQDQARSIPALEKDLFAGMATPQILEIIEGEGGRFGLARIPWQESEREQAFRRIVEYSGLRIAFPEEMNMVSRNLLRLLGSYVGPGDSRRKVDGPQREMLAKRVGDVPADLSEADAGDGLAFMQAVEAAKSSGLLRTYPSGGVTVEEAAKAHDLD